MTDTAWVPLSRRTRGGPPDDSLIVGVPDYLAPPLKRWAATVLERYGGRELRETVQLRVGLLIPSVDPIAAALADSPDGSYLPGDDRLLDVVDAVLHWSPWSRQKKFWPAAIEELEKILNNARSMWRVNARGDGLEERLDATVTAAAAATVRSASAEAGEHLAEAWAAAYGRHRDPDKAYSEAVKAVEAVACPLVLPTLATATLGRVRDHLRDAPGKWELVLPGKDGTPADVAPLVAMLTLLWEGQRSRHAGTASSRRQSPEEGEGAVHLAVTVVQWLTAGVLRRRS